MTIPSAPNDQPVVMIGASVRSAIESASKVGIPTIAVDCFGDRGTIHSAQSWIPIDDFPVFWQKLRVEMNPPDDSAASPPPTPKIAIVGGIYGRDEILADCDGPFLGGSPECFRQCDRPEFLESIARQAGVEFPPTFRIDSDGGQRVLGEATKASNTARSWLVKSPSSCGGLGVQNLQDVVSSAETLQPALPPGAVVQQRLPGKVLGVSYLGTDQHAQLMGACRLLKKRLGNRPYVFAGAVGPISISDALSKQLEALGQAFVAHCPFQGPFNIDVIVRGNQTWLLEINPRWSGSMELIERSWEPLCPDPCSFFAPSPQWIDVVERTYQTGSDRKSKCPLWIKRILFAGNDLTIDPHELVRRENEKGTWKDVPSNQSLIARSTPIATWITSLNKMTIQEVFRLEVPSS